MRQRVNLYLLRGLGSIVLLATVAAGHARAQNIELAPTFGSLSAKGGIKPNPFVKQLVAGGKIKTQLGGVNAYVANAPDFKLYYTAGAFPLIIRVDSKADTTLLINLPDGTWVADDDSGGNLNPLLRFAKPQSGRYDIYVGTFAKDFADATLIISEDRPKDDVVASNPPKPKPEPKREPPPDRNPQGKQRSCFRNMGIQRGGLAFTFNKDGTTDIPNTKWERVGKKITLVFTNTGSTWPFAIHSDHLTLEREGYTPYDLYKKK